MIDIDRLTPTRRPMGRPRGYQRWQSLLFLHWTLPPEIIRPLVPASLELDLYDGEAYVGVVPFQMRAIRPSWVPKAMGLNFLETNVRTYVHHQGRPGVYFFSLDASSRLAVWVAKQFWGLPYYLATMKSSTAGDLFHYSLQRCESDARFAVDFRVGDPLASSQPGSIEFFLLERYLLFVERQAQLLVGQVHHHPYPVHAAEVASLDDRLVHASGFDRIASNPVTVHYSPGVDVEVFSLAVVPTA